MQLSVNCDITYISIGARTAFAFSKISVKCRQG